MCKQKQESTGITKPSVLTKRRSFSGLSVTLKRVEFDEKTLEETVMTNKSSFSSLLQKHAAWMVPTGQQSTTARATGKDVDAPRPSSTIASPSDDVAGPSVPHSQLSETVASQDARAQEICKLESTAVSIAFMSVSPLAGITVKSISKSPQPAVTNPLPGEVIFQAVSTIFNQLSNCA